MGLYTDLAVEARELNPEINGVTEENENFGDISVTRIAVSAEEAARLLGKQIGNYITLDAPKLTERPLDLFDAASERLAFELNALLSGIRDNSNVVIAGLGNRSVTPDALGPRTAERVFITRHIIEHFPDAFEYPVISVASIEPGVLGSTGVETFELIKGLIDRIHPDAIIAIDSLASRRASRISTTIQLSDAGIDPGAGVGNIRAGLTLESLGVPVIAIGVPLVVYASTITTDTISMIADETGMHGDEEKLKELAEKVANEKMGDMIVTPKDIDTIIEDMSGILAKGINKALFGEHYDDIRTLVV